MVFAQSDRQVVRAWRVSFSALQPVRRVTIIVTAGRKMLEHVFAGETAVAAGNGCIGCLGVLWLPLGDSRRPFAEVDLWTPVTAHAHRVTVTASTVLATCDETAYPVIRSEATLAVAIETANTGTSAMASHRRSR